MSTDDNKDFFIERRVSVLEGSHNFMKEGLQSIVNKLDDLLKQGEKVVIIAERQEAHRLDLEKAALRIKEVEKNHADLNKTVTEFISFINGLTKLAYILWTTLGALVMLMLIKILFFIGSIGFTP